MMDRPDSRNIRSSPGLMLAGVALGACIALSAACASTGASPRPFPVPGHPAPSRDTPREESGEAGAFTYAITGTALALRGTPYRNGGIDPSGFDCSGFTQYVFGQHGIALPRDVRDQFRSGHAVASDHVEPGDLLFFSTSGHGPTHVAIALGGDEFVHAPSSAGVVRVEHLSGGYWPRRYVGARRVVGGQSTIDNSQFTKRR